MNCYKTLNSEEFQKIYGIDPIEAVPGQVMWYYWKLYRAGKITDFVNLILKFKEVQPNYNLREFVTLVIEKITQIQHFC